MRRDRLLPLSCALFLVPGCGDAEPSSDDADQAATATDGDEDGSGTSQGQAPPDDAALTYWRDAKAILDAKCASCHRPDDIAPFSLETYEDVRAVAAILPGSITSGLMPPWPPSDDCEPIAHSRALTADEQALLLAWLDDDAPEGDPADAPAADPDAEPPFSPTVTLQMPEPYTPQQEPDDYRCFVVPWAETDTTYITGLKVEPGNRSVVHHVIVFNVDPQTASQVEALDEADPGPGYACFGGAGTMATWIGSWAPGSSGQLVPEGTGMRIEPGSLMVLQLHYNTLSSAPESDQTSVQIELADEVERPALTLPFTNFQWVTGGEPMLIPAGDPEVTHSYELATDNLALRSRLADIGIGADDPFVVHASGLHMHQLGTKGTLSVVRGGQDSQCLLDIPEWDFGWQGGYALVEPMVVRPEDSLRISCTWDNSESNQPIVDGEVLAPRDVQWGEGTTDEMCLGVLYLTGQ